jgi:hypothetical protein
LQAEAASPFALMTALAVAFQERLSVFKRLWTGRQDYCGRYEAYYGPPAEGRDHGELRRQILAPLAIRKARR